MAKTTRIVQVCEPLFLYICELNRLRREGVPEEASAMQFVAVRDRVDTLLTAAQAVAGESNQLRDQWNLIERPLCCFLDSMIEEIMGPRNGEKALACAGKWARRRLAEEKFNIVTGDDAFFDFLDQELERPDNDPGARERLEFFHVCLGLGFTGKYQSDPDSWDGYQQKVAGRVPHLLKKRPDDQYTPRAYEHVNSARLNLEPQPVLWGVVILTIAVLIFFFVATVWLYRDSSKSLKTAIKEINEYGDTHEGLHK